MPLSTCTGAFVSFSPPKKNAPVLYKQESGYMKYFTFLIRCSVYFIVLGLYLTTTQHAGAKDLGQNRPASVSAPSPAKDYSITPEKLVGQWNRTDGNYTIEINKIGNSEKLEAAYYNPRPIHIAQTKISPEKGKIKIFIELQDTGYPGSTYTLDYIFSEDVLKGTYFHAGIQQQFQVLFTREKKQAQ